MNNSINDNIKYIIFTYFHNRHHFRTFDTLLKSFIRAHFIAFHPLFHFQFLFISPFHPLHLECSNSHFRPDAQIIFNQISLKPQSTALHCLKQNQFRFIGLKESNLTKHLSCTRLCLLNYGQVSLSYFIPGLLQAYGIIINRYPQIF